MENTINLQDKDNLFASFQQKNRKMEDLYKKAQAVFDRLGQSADNSSLANGIESIQSDSFKVLVVGEFKRGKSTFINALIGQEILPAFSVPCTAVINEIKWDEAEHAMLHFTNPIPEKIPHKLAPDVLKHINAHKGKEVPPMEIPVDRIEEFVTIPDPGKDHAQSVFESPFKLVELFYPLSLCKNRVELIDSPGLNEHKTRTEVTANYICQADAIIFVMTCEALASMSELSFIENSLRANGHEDIFFVLNRFDNVRERERPRLIKYAQERLADKTSLGETGLHFVSARDALDAKLDNHPEELSETGFVKLEQDLTRFLVQDRGRIKLLRPGRELRRILDRAIIDVIPQELDMLRENRETLEQRYRKAQPQIREAEMRRAIIREKIMQDREGIKQLAQRAVYELILNMANNIEPWLAEYEPVNKIEFLTFNSSKDQAKAIMEECIKYVSEQMNEMQTIWEQEVFRPLIENAIKKMADNLDSSLDSFYANILEIKNVVTGTTMQEQENKVNCLERTLAAAGGFLVGGIGSAMLGATMGMQEMLKSLIPNIAVFIGCIIIGITNPWIIIPALLGVSGIQALLSCEAMGTKIRDKTAKELAAQLRSKASESSIEAAEKIYEKTQSIMDSIDAGLKNEICSITDSVESVLKSMKSGQEEMTRKQVQLNQDKETLKQIKFAAEDLMDNL